MTNSNYFGVSAMVLVAVLVAGLVLALVAGTEPADAQAAPNGEIAFKSERDGNQEIYLMDPDGTDQTRLTDNPAVDFSPALSPDGTRIAFMSDRDGNEEIYVMDAAPEGPTNQPQRLTDDPATDVRPDFSPDGAKIAFESYRDGNYEIYVMDAEDLDNDGNGDNLIQLTNNPALDYAPDFSPDGNRIAFTSDRDGNEEIYVMEAEDLDNDGNGDNPTRLTNDPASDLVPDFSPDGNRITFSSNRSGKYKIYVMNSSNGSGQTRLTGNKGSDHGPVFSPDGTKIAFYSLSEQTVGTDIFTMNADGSSKTRLTTARKDDTLPNWEPRP